VTTGISGGGNAAGAFSLAQAAMASSTARDAVTYGVVGALRSGADMTVYLAVDVV
jgi:hypothetical protein